MFNYFLKNDLTIILHFKPDCYNNKGITHLKNTPSTLALMYDELILERSEDQNECVRSE